MDYHKLRSCCYLRNRNLYGHVCVRLIANAFGRNRSVVVLHPYRRCAAVDEYAEGGSVHLDVYLAVDGDAADGYRLRKVAPRCSR